MLTELRCSVCAEPYFTYRPSRDEQDEPVCPLCRVTDFEQVAKLLGYRVPERTARRDEAQ